MQVLGKFAYHYTCLLLFCSIFPSALQSQTPAEYQVKAAFIYNFTQFIDWPPNSFTSTNDPIIITIIGDNPFDDFLNIIVADEQVKGRPIQVRYINSIEELGQSHILYVGEYSKSKMKELNELCKSRNILSIGEEESFIKAGGIIRFITVNNRVNFQINASEAKEAGFKISSKVLRLAEIVETNKK